MIDGRELPVSRRQSVSTDGTLRIKDVDRTRDSGTYACSATNKQGESHERSLNIRVVGKSFIYIYLPVHYQI